MGGTVPGDHILCHGYARTGLPAGKSKIAESEITVRIHEQVRRLQVPMHHLMKRFKSAGVSDKLS